MINFERITSKDNDIIKHASALIKSSKKRHEEGLFVLEGLRLCRDAEQNGFEAECFIVGETALKKFSGDAEMIAEKAARACVVSDNLIAKISDTVNPQGFISICKIKNNI